MRKNLLKLLMLACLLFSKSVTQAQSTPPVGNYIVTGFFFTVPPLGGPLSLVKTLTKTGTDKYNAHLANIGGAGYQFDFGLNTSNHLVDWAPVDSTPLSSGFMTLDNPGGVDYGYLHPGPGFNDTVYNNTYDPATQTFYMHYGYHGGGAATDGQNTYTRQVYEKWEYDTVRIISFTPAVAGDGAGVIIKGRKFTGATGVSFGGIAAASFKVLSDTVIRAVVGTGASGAIKVITPHGSAVKPGFIYCTRVTPSVTIKSNTTSLTICAGTKVTFEAMSLHTGDSAKWQWKKNGRNVGTNSHIYVDSLLKTGDSVWVLLNSDAPCATTTTVKSNVLVFKVIAKVTPAVIIRDSIGEHICAGTRVKFTAFLTNGGLHPFYQWKKNGINVGTDSDVYITDELKTGDSIKVVVAANIDCSVADRVTSNVIVFTVSERVKPSTTIEANKDSVICVGTPVRFTAIVVNGGTHPVFQWKINDHNVGTNSSIFIDSLLKSGQLVRCKLTGDAACSVPDTAISNAIGFVVQNGKPAKPSAIVGQHIVKPGLAHVEYSVTKIAGVKYAWTVPTTSFITSGQGTNSILVTWGIKSGLVTVRAVNVCGASEPVTDSVSVSAGLNAVLYPNPARDMASLQVSGYKGKVEIIVTDMTGRVMTMKTLYQDYKMAGQYLLPVSNLGAGLYIVTVKDDVNITSLKLIKVK